MTELLILMAIVAIVVAFLAPAINRARENSGRVQCIDNLKQIVLGLHKFESTHKRLPPLYGGVASPTDQASTKFPNVWGSTHVFILPFIGQEPLWRSIALGDPPDYLPSLAQTKVVPEFICPLDPSTGASAELGGTSYAANALVFAPLVDETITGGSMYPSTKANYCDRGAPLIRLQNGSTNVIGFVHSYSLCGSENKGTSWLYTAGLNSPPSTVQALQPWSRASYIGQKALVPAGERAFQNQPSPFERAYDAATGSGCDPLLPATPHANEIIVGMMGGAARTIYRVDVDIAVWNRAHFPNCDPFPMGWSD